MFLTIQNILSSPGILSAIIDRTLATNMDTVYWREYLSGYSQANADGTFRTFIGNVTGVIAGTVIDRYSGKPIRQRHALGSGFGEVACLGDRYQIDNASLEQLQILIDTYNRAEKAQQPGALDDIINFLVDDMRQCLLAPMKRFDIMVGDLMYTGKTSVNGKANKRGVSIEEIKLPITTIKATAADKDNILTWMKSEFVDKLRPKGYSFAYADMNLSTFNNHIASSKEFLSKYTLKFGDMEYSTSNIITPDMVNRVITALGIPFVIRIKDMWIQTSETESKNFVPDDKISFKPAGTIGDMKFKLPYEMRDPIPGRTYANAEDGRMFISSYRTEEGRFMEYGMEAIPNITIPNKMAIADLSELSA